MSLDAYLAKEKLKEVYRRINEATMPWEDREEEWQ